MRRRTGTIIHEGAAIEVAIDTGAIVAGDATEPVAELELELKQGPPAALFSLARALSAAAPLRLGVCSKSARGHALADRARRDEAIKGWPDALAGEMSAGDAFARVAGACIRQFRLNEAALLRTGRADALHRARVALRRLRSALSTLAPGAADDRIRESRGGARLVARAGTDA